MGASNGSSSKYQKPGDVLLVVAFSIFAIEITIRQFFPYVITLNSPWLAYLLDMFLLSILFYPVVYIFLIRPKLLPINERKRTKQEIKLLAKFPSGDPNPVLRVHKDGRIQFANPASRPVLDAMGSRKGGFLAKEWRRRVSEIYKSKQSKELELTHLDQIFSVTIMPFAGTDYLYVYGHNITKQKQNEGALDCSERKLQGSLEKMQKFTSGIVNSMTLIVETRDPYTAGHQRRVADLARAIARGLKLPDKQVDGIWMAGLIHDLGKIGVPVEILSKPVPLSHIEFDLIKTHPQLAYEILKTIEFPWPIAQTIFHHHERINGSGYPLGLSDSKISLDAKILAIADVVEAMGFQRPYRPALGVKTALNEISENSGILYDPEAAKVCLKLFRKEKFQFN